MGDVTWDEQRGYHGGDGRRSVVPLRVSGTFLTCDFMELHT